MMGGGGRGGEGEEVGGREEEEWGEPTQVTVVIKLQNNFVERF